MHAQAIAEKELQQTPAALARLGADIFAAMPLYRARKTCRPVYINRAAYAGLFTVPADTPWEDMAAALTALFSTTIEPENGTGEVVGTAYADRQRDPLDLSLSGNLGSGRAYYMGRFFNVKGERTPLATSPRRQFSDGLVEMERAIWETVVANSLQGELHNGLNDVLAIIDMDDLCQVSWRDKPVRRAKVIRIDRDGCLDRITHLFQSPRPLPGDALSACARAYGRLEADKFTARINHGTWSPGNISLRGHLIDFDTVCAVKGRGPTYSSTRWYAANRFGFEKAGQAAVLGAIAADAALNADGVDIAALQAEMDAAQARQTALNFVALMGFDDAEKLYAAHQDDIDALVALWDALARKTYPNRRALSLKEAASVCCHVFDFSLFFSFYPLLARTGRFDAAACVQAMRAPNSLLDEVSNTAPLTLTDIEQEHHDQVESAIGAHIVDDAPDHAMLDLAALSFVRKYDRLHQRLRDASGETAEAVEARALARNEDRYYLFPAFTVSFRLAQNRWGWPPQRLHRVISALIDSCRRPCASGAGYVWQLRLFSEGCFYRLLAQDGTHRLGFTPFDEGHKIDKIQIDGEIIPLDPASGLSAPLDNDRLLPLFIRESSLHEPEISIYSQNEHIDGFHPLTPLAQDVPHGEREDEQQHQSPQRPD